MSVRDIFRVNRRTFFDPSSWVGYSILSQQTQFIKSVLAALFRKPTPKRTETFAEAMQRFQLTEEEIDAMATDYRVYAGVLALLGLTSVGYCFYLLLHHVAIISFLMGLCVSMLFFAYAFRYDFWAFQLRQRRLGCTFGEWRASLFSPKRNL